MREIPRAQRRALAQPWSAFADRFATPREAMAPAFQIGAYRMQEIAEHFGVALLDRQPRPASVRARRRLGRAGVERPDESFPDLTP